MVVYRLCRRESFPLTVASWLIYRKKKRASELGLRTQSTLPFLATLLTRGFVGTLIDQNGYGLIASLPGHPPLGGMPAITSAAWNWVDLTFGLLMVGIREDLVFRGFLHTFIRRYTNSASVVLAISSIAFGLIHWSPGLHVVIITSIIGAVFMTAYPRTQSLPAIMLAHFAVNFIDFAGAIPKSIFKVHPANEAVPLATLWRIGPALAFLGAGGFVVSYKKVKRRGTLIARSATA